MKANEILAKHLQAFKNGEIKISSVSPKFQTSKEVLEYLQKGEILPALFNTCAEKTVSITEQMFLYSILKFSSDRIEKKFSNAFIKAVNQLESMVNQ